MTGRDGGLAHHWDYRPLLGQMAHTRITNSHVGAFGWPSMSAANHDQPFIGRYAQQRTKLVGAS